MTVEAARILRALPVSGEQLLRHLGCDLDFADQSVTGARAQMARLVSALQASPAAPEIEQRLADIDMMSDWLGQTCLREAVRAEAPELFDDLMHREGAHERAALVQFARPNVFEGACRRRYFSRHRLQRKACARFRTISKTGWEPSEADLRALVAALEPLLHEALRTGESIIVDPIIRSASSTGAFVQLSLYAAGAAQRIEEVDGVDLVQRVIRPAFACVIGYWPGTGNLEIVVRNGTFALKVAIAGGFVAAVLGGAANDIENMAEPTITLDGLLMRPVLGFDPEDNIASIKLIELDVRSMARNGAAVTLSARDKLSDVWDTAAEFIKDSALLASIATRAKFRVEYIAAGTGRKRAAAFELTPPHGYTPRGETEMELLIIQKYLPRWGLMATIGIEP